MEPSSSRAPIDPATSTVIPTVDLSPYTDGGDAASRKKVRDTIFEACKKYGVFQITNTGDSLIQCEKLLDMTKTFFSLSEDKKEKSTRVDHKMAGTGYGKARDHYHHYEYLLMLSPDQQYNGVPTFPPDQHGILPIKQDYRKTFDKVFKYFVKTSGILEKIINDCLGLPSNFLTNFNNDRSSDFMLPLSYTISTRTEKIGIDNHEDPNMFTLVLQHDVSGLMFFNNDDLIPLIPKKGTLVVIVGDLIQVLSNKKFTHVTHKAFKNTRSERLAIDFVYNVAPDTSIYPLPQLIEKGDRSKYREFKFKEYIDLIMEDMKNPPARVEDFIDITYFEKHYYGFKK